jgi:hypothetical protein
MPINETPQSNKQHAVPQNIMDVEFKLIGDLTMRQFFYLLVFVGGAYVMYVLGLPGIIRIPGMLISILAGVAFAFMPVEDRGLDEWIVYFSKAVFTDLQRVWHKKAIPLNAFMYDNLSLVKQELITLAPTASRRKLERYLEGQHAPAVAVDAYAKREQEYIQKVQTAFADMVPQQTTVTTTVDGPEFEFEELEEKPAQEEPAEKPEIPVAIPPVQKPVVEKIETPKVKPTEVKETPIQPKIVKRAKIRKVKPSPIIPTPARPISPSAAMTPNRHTGRIFTSLLPDEGTIVLPIRGEKIIKPQEEQELEVRAAEKAAQLKTYIEQIKTGKGLVTPPKQAVKETEVKEDLSVIKDEEKDIDAEAKDLIRKLQLDNEKLQKQMDKLQKDITKVQPEDKKKKEEALKKLQKESGKTTKTISKLVEQVSEITGSSPEELVLVETEETKAPTTANIEHLRPKLPNLIAGIVKNSEGNTLPNTLLIIKNAKNDPVRAIKTNDLGEFVITNPLANGGYKIEVDINNSTGKTFDIIEFEARGEIIKPMEFVGN